MSVMKSIFSSVNGFSMTELMVGVGLLGGVSIVTMKVMQDQANNESTMKYTAAVNRATMQIQTALGNNARCNQMLVGRTRESAAWPNINFGAASTLNSLQFTEGGKTTILLEHNKAYDDGFYIPPNGIRLANSALGSAVSEVIIRFHTRRMGAKGPATLANNTNPHIIIKRIPFMVTMESNASGPTNTIKACGPVVSDSDVAAKKTMCLSLGEAATWDDTANTCTLNNMTCPTGQIPIEVASLGKFNCMPATQANMTEIFSFDTSSCAPGQSVTLRPNASGKIQAVCVGTPTGCAAGVRHTWKVGDNTCVAETLSTSGTFNITTQAFADSTGPTTGNASFFCSDGRKTWVQTGAVTCVNTSANCAAGQIVRWSGASKFCEATSPALAHEATGSVTDSSNYGGSDGTGTASLQCTNGTVSIIGTPTCT